MGGVLEAMSEVRRPGSTLSREEKSALSDPPGKSLEEDWMEVSSSRRGKSRLFVRLLADRLTFYDKLPPMGNTVVQPLDVVLFSRVVSVLGRNTSRHHLRVIDVGRNWWDLRSDPPEKIDGWAEKTVSRVENFRRARRRISIKVSPGDNLPITSAMSQRNIGGVGKLILCLAKCSPCDPDKGDFSAKVSVKRTPMRDRREGRETHSLFADEDELALVSDPDLQEAQAAHWSEQAVQYLKKCETLPPALVPDFRLTVRMGVPDGLKKYVWTHAAGLPISTVNSLATQASYDALLRNCYGEFIPESFCDPVPTFCQGILGTGAPNLDQAVTHLKLLTEEGQMRLRRLLWCISLASHGVELSPFLPNLLAALLVFYDEAEVFAIVASLIKIVEMDRNSEKSANPRILVTRGMLNKQAKLLVQDGRKNQVVVDVLDHLSRLKIDVHTVAVKLLQDGLAHALPFRALCRVMGSYLGEGSEVLLRYALALLKVQSEALLKCTSAEDAEKLLANLGEGLDTPELADTLCKVAFSMRVRVTGLERISSSWGTSYITADLNMPVHIFCRPRLSAPRGHCPDELWEAIWSRVPDSVRIFDPKLLWDRLADGMSLRFMLEKCKKHIDSPMVFFIWTPQGDIIGGYSPSVWVKTNGYLDTTTLCRSAESAFVFNKIGDKAPEFWFWTGFNELLLQASEQRGLAFGGDAPAITVDKNLIRAGTSASRTFKSPSLIAPTISETATDEPFNDDGSLRGISHAEFEILRFEIFMCV
mmetsp:Transcript_47957/g.104330  ORF Transcript_47957/g.104330 Transcript_47957/m.104330 type:complete len:760 (-) Transcript_47957:94-2373(-)